MTKIICRKLDCEYNELGICTEDRVDLIVCSGAEDGAGYFICDQDTTFR